MTVRKIRRVIESLTKDGTREWRLDGKLHRIDGPALIRLDGCKGWYFMGELHREDGPAIYGPNIIGEYYLEGQELSKEEYLRIDASKYRKLQIYQIMRL